MLFLVPLGLLVLASPVAGEHAVPKFAFSWLDNKDTFRAGEVATIRIKVLENFDKIDKDKFNPILTVDGKTGNSSFISGVLSDFGFDHNYWRISFTPIKAGLFNVMINEDSLRVFDYSLHFRVFPGKIYPSVCVASWMGQINEFEAGTRASVLVLPKDAFGNNVSSMEEPDVNNFTLSAFSAKDSFVILPNITYTGWNKLGYIIVEFAVTIAGNFFLNVGGGNQTLNGPPLPFKVNPGLLEIANCMIKWDFEPKGWQLFSKMEIFIHQRDRFDNLVPGLYAFDAEIVEQETNLSIPISDLHFEEAAIGIQLISFSNLELGNFWLTISDTAHDKSISRMPYAYTVYAGYCNGSTSIVNETGSNTLVAGEMAGFSVHLQDMYQYPCPVEVGMLQVLILRKIDSHYVWPVIDGMANESTAFAPSGDQSNMSVSYSKFSSDFDVTYTPDKSGDYEIGVFCGNIQLNSGRWFRKEVIAGEVNISLSGVVRFAPKVPKLAKNEIEVQLKDSYFNPILSQHSRLTLEIVSSNSAGFSSWIFVDKNNGSYIAQYIASNVGTYEICASFDGNHLSPCPFMIHVYSGEYFPMAYNDTVSVWQDESVAFDALANDYYAGDNASIVFYTNVSPNRNTLLKIRTTSDPTSLLNTISAIEYGRLLRYTPCKDYYGNDSVIYTISDINGNLATAAVNVLILSIPPQFISFPSQLSATEDVISPKFLGFSGFELQYSDKEENISINITAQSGSIFLSPMLLQLDQSIWSTLSIEQRDEESEVLNLEGCLEAINFALQSIQYLGNANFSGDDTIKFSARNRNGVNALEVPIFVEPINDPPYIHVPEVIVMKSYEGDSLIFGRERDFSIGDPDIPTSPGGVSNFAVAFSLEVSDGSLITSLPAELVSTTELKFKKSHQWIPLQTYVTISKHFTVKASGIRFRGTFNHCNDVMQQLQYSGGGADLLTVTLNDMGNFGCYPDCFQKISVPLYAEATVTLIRREQTGSVLAHALGSAIVIESVSILSLGILLMIYIWKCAILLIKERRNRDPTNSKPSPSQASQKSVANSGLSDRVPCSFGCCSSPLLLGSGPSNSCQR